MNTSDRIRIQHMLDAALEAQKFIAGKNRSDLDEDRLLSLALTKEIEIIGEAASKVSHEVRTKYAFVQWGDIIGMRNHLIHGYFNVDLDLLWNTLHDDLPPLIIQLETVLADLSQENEE